MRPKGRALWAAAALAGVCVAALLAGGAADASGTAAGSSKPAITIGYASWPEDTAVATLWREILVRAGQRVRLEKLLPSELFPSLASGRVDALLDVWLPATDGPAMERYHSSVVKLSTWYSGPAEIGIAAPRSAPVVMIRQLGGATGAFRGPLLVVGPPNGHLAALTQRALDHYGVHPKVSYVSQGAMLKALGAAVAQGRDIAVTLWRPHFAWTRWQLKYLYDPDRMFGGTEHIAAVANRTWAKSHPGLARWLSSFNMTPWDLRDLEREVNAAGSPTAGARKWLADNRSLIHSWLTAAPGGVSRAGTLGGGSVGPPFPAPQA